MDEINIAGIHYQNFHFGLGFKESKVAILDLFQIIKSDVLLIGSTPLGDVLQEALHGKVKIYIQPGCWGL